MRLVEGEQRPPRRRVAARERGGVARAEVGIRVLLVGAQLEQPLVSPVVLLQVLGVL